MLFFPAILKPPTCTPVFIATLSTITKTWKQPKYSLIEEWIKKIWYICTMGYYSVMKKNKVMPFTEAMDEPRYHHSE